MKKLSILINLSNRARPWAPDGSPMSSVLPSGLGGCNPLVILRKADPGRDPFPDPFWTSPGSLFLVPFIKRFHDLSLRGVMESLNEKDTLFGHFYTWIWGQFILGFGHYLYLALETI